MVEDRLAEGDALLGEVRGFSQSALRDGHAAERISGARKVQHFQNQMYPAVGGAEQPGLAGAQFDLARGHGASGYLVLQAADSVVQFAVFAALRQQEQRDRKSV